MRKILFTLALFLQALALFAQKREQGFDHSFKPTTAAPRYYVVTEKKDTLWHRAAWYLPERGLAMEGWYKDKDCTIAHGSVLWYHPNKILKSKQAYVNGKKEGTWLEYDEEGRLRDSAHYEAGRRKGVQLHWHSTGMLADSMQFDGAGNGVEVSWYEEGNLFFAGYWVSDTIRKGRWKYFHPTGKVMATEDYVDGKQVAYNCFDETGQQLDSAACLEIEAEFPGDAKAWSRFLAQSLNSLVPIENGARPGLYTVVVQFVVGTDGSIEQIKPLTRHGYGMEKEVERILKASPRWIPARQYGRKVKAYRKQPITFMVSKE